jgi:hypothetical protein
MCEALSVTLCKLLKIFVRIHLCTLGDNKYEQVGMATPADFAAFNGV